MRHVVETVMQKKKKSRNCKWNACDRGWEIYHHQSASHINATGKDLLPKLPLQHSQRSAVDAFGGSLVKYWTQKLGHVSIKDKSNYRFDYYLRQTMRTGGTKPSCCLPLYVLASLWNEKIWSWWKFLHWSSFLHMWYNQCILKGGVKAWPGPVQRQLKTFFSYRRKIMP